MEKRYIYIFSRHNTQRMHAACMPVFMYYIDLYIICIIFTNNNVLMVYMERMERFQISNKHTDTVQLHIYNIYKNCIFRFDEIFSDDGNYSTAIHIYTTIFQIQSSFGRCILWVACVYSCDIYI